MRTEAFYQKKLIEKLQDMFPGCFIIRNDPAELQGIPDLLILYRNTWAMLEVKLSGGHHVMPNQEYYVNLFGQMSFASFIFPENETQVLHELQHAFGS